VIDAPSVFLAFTAGFLSFLSPCCLPMVPGYLATVLGSRMAGAPDIRRVVVVRRSLLFIGTFSLLFILLGLGATAAGSLFRDHRSALETTAGVAMIAMGALMICSIFIMRLGREWRSSTLLERAGDGGPVIAGAAFAIAWTPCVGPTLGAILSLAATSAGTAEGGALLAVYSLGLGIPFFMSAIAFERTTRLFKTMRRHQAAIQGAAGAMLVTMGILVLTGELYRLNIAAQRLLSDTGLDFLYNL
jgi:cytochrome c-type biogenesis protein